MNRDGSYDSAGTAVKTTGSYRENGLLRDTMKDQLSPQPGGLNAVARLHETRMRLEAAVRQANVVLNALVGPMPEPPCDQSKQPVECVATVLGSIDSLLAELESKLYGITNAIGTSDFR